MRRGNFRRIIPALLAGLGLGVPNVGSLVPVPTVAQAQQSGKEQAAAPVAQVPQANVAIDHRAFLGATQRHPIWLGIAKRGKGRKSGARSKWDYRR